MIILDLNQVMISNLMAQIGNHTNSQLDEGMLRHMILNAIRANKTKFSEQYGELVIACDNFNYWRKQLFPYYKANRKKNIEASELDWKTIFEALNKVRAELKDNFPYRVIEVESAEADDIIATLSKRYCQNEKVLILSGDKDFIQLQRYPNIEQFDPVRKRKITHDNPESFLREHILRGDSGDGVPNFLSPDNCLVIGERQKPITKTRLERWLIDSPEKFCDENILRNYRRNEQLIDLEKIPTDIKTKILSVFDNYEVKPRNNLYKYFMAHNLKYLLENIGDF